MNRIASGQGGGLPGRRGWRVWIPNGLVGLTLVAGVAGCHTVKESTPLRTATEQLLLSSAADCAMEKVHFGWLEGRRVFVEEKHFESYDKGYAVGLIRERLAISGALLVNKMNQADVVVEIRSGVLSMDSTETLVGLPAMNVPVPLTGMVQTPELSLYKSKRADAIAKVALFAYERRSGRYLQSDGPMLGRAHLRLYRVLFVTWQRTNIPELSRPGKKKPVPVQPAPGARPEGR